ncbi:MAG: cupin domain-containing protein [Candidatus Thorarchaeota archaeon]|jgi:quercetin dioxygenase-like cupin family protein
MIEDFFDNIVKKLPRIKVSVPGVQGWVLQGAEFQAVFFEIEKSTVIPPHSHGPQFGFIIDGNAVFKIDENVNRMTTGDSYYIPEGAVHEIAFDTFTRVVDFFFQKDRYEIEE